MSDVATSASAAYALQRALAEHPVLPLCWPNADGTCGCPGEWDAKRGKYVPHEAKNVGKAPIGKAVPNGYLDASSDPETVLGWWSEFPNANVGESNEPNGWLVIDPDSAAALAEAHKLGLSPTLTRHSRNVAFIYQRPDDCPAVSVKKIGKDGNLDLLGDGYLVTFGTHQNGTSISLEGETIAPSPRWAVERIKQEATNRQRKKQAAAARIASSDDDEPPVYLGEPDSYAMKVWCGETFKKNPDGTVERSGSLVKLGRVLYDAGATRRTIVQALAERDDALGWRKYTERPDAAEQYHRIVNELEDKGRNPRTWPTHTVDTDAAPVNGQHGPHCERYHAPVERAQQQVIAELRAELEKLRTGDQANGKRLTHLKQFRQTSSFSGKRKDVVEAIAFEVERARERGVSRARLYYGDREKRKEGEDPGGIAATANCSPDTVEDTVDMLRAATSSPWKFETVRDQNGNRRVEIIFDPRSTTERDLAQVATLPKAETVRKAPLRCPHHPDARLQVSKVCTMPGCGLLVAEYLETPPTLAESFRKEPATRPPTVVPSPGWGNFPQGSEPADPDRKPSARDAGAFDPSAMLRLVERLDYAEVKIPGSRPGTVAFRVGGSRETWEKFCTNPPPTWPEVCAAVFQAAGVPL